MVFRFIIFKKVLELNVLFKVLKRGLFKYGFKFKFSWLDEVFLSVFLKFSKLKVLGYKVL